MYGVSTAFIFATIILGIITLYLYRDRLGDIEEERNHEQKEEEKRIKEFAGTFPRLNRIPVLRRLVKWMYKEGWYSEGLVLLVLVGFGLRILNLDFLSPVKDEYAHLVGAKRFMLEGTFNYPRAAFLTYIVGFLFKLNGGTSLFLGRLPSVIFGTLSIIAIYFLAKKVNKKVGMISAYLLTFSPFAIGLSRYLREYQAYFLFVLLFLIYFIYFFKNIINFSSRWKQNKTRILIETFVVFLPVIYYVFVENVVMIYELYLICFIFTIVFLIFQFIKSKNKINSIFDKYNKKIFLMFLIIFVLLFLSTSTFLKSYDYLFPDKGFSEKEIKYENCLFNPDGTNPHSKLQWFSGTYLTKPFAIFLFVLPILFFYRNKYFISNLFSFLAIFLAFLYVVDRYFAERYIYYSLPFYVIIYSCSILILFKFVNIFEKKAKIIPIVIVYILLLSFFSPITGINGLINEDKSPNDSKTGLYHRDTFELMDYLKKNNFSEDDILISSNQGEFLYYYNYDFVENESEWPYWDWSYYNYNSSDRDYGYIFQAADIYSIRKIVNKFEKGWIVIQCNKATVQNNLYPIVDEELFDKGLIYLDHVGTGDAGYDVYKWG